MENDKSYAYVRQQDAPLLPPPISEAGLIEGLIRIFLT